MIIVSNEEASNYNASSASVYFNVFRANSFINVIGIVNGTYNTSDVVVGFDIVNKTNVTIVITNIGTSTTITLNNFDALA